MTTRQTKLPGIGLDSAQKVMRAAMHLWTRTPEETAPRKPRVFVTVSRQPGAGGKTFSHRLAERLNAQGAADWSAWDQELVERVSREYGISREVIEMIPNRNRSWFSVLVETFSSHPRASEFGEMRADQRILIAIRALAEQGHAIIVGQGGAFVTENLPGAIHLRLVASLEHRIKHTAEREQLSLLEAAQQVAETDDHRADFYRRFWPGKVISPEQFTMTLNSGEMSVEEMVEAVVPVIRLREAALAEHKETPPLPQAGGNKERTVCHASSYCI